MITRMEEAPRVVRVTLTLDPVDVDLLDRLAALDGKNRSAEVREMLGAMRPTIRAMVEAMESVARQREQIGDAAARALLSDMEVLMPEVQALNLQFAASLARVEGAQAASRADALDAADPRPSNHGGHTPTPTTPPAPSGDDS